MSSSYTLKGMREVLAKLFFALANEGAHKHILVSEDGFEWHNIVCLEARKTSSYCYGFNGEITRVFKHYLDAYTYIVGEVGLVEANRIITQIYLVYRYG